MRQLVIVLWMASACGSHATPPPVTPTPASGIRYIIGGDSRDDRAHVMPWAIREAKARAALAFVFLGDMELDPALRGHFERELVALDPIPFYPVLGNHEVKRFGLVGIGHDHEEKAFRRHFLDTARTPVASSLPDKVVYAVELPGGVHFIALDNVSQKGFGADQLAWLSADLDHARADPATKYIIVGMHKPLAHDGISKRGMESDGDQAIADSDAALALLVRAKASLIVASHLHEYAQTTLGGIPFYITGGLGAPLARAAGSDHAFHHLLQVDVGPEGLHVSVVRFGGDQTLTDEDDPD